MARLSQGSLLASVLWNTDGTRRRSEELGFAYAEDLEELSLDRLEEGTSVALMHKYGLTAKVRRVMPCSLFDEMLGTPLKLEFMTDEVCRLYESLGQR